MISMNQAQFEQYAAQDQPVLVEFWAPWCVYCRRIAPALDKISDRRTDLVVGQVNIDEVPLLAAKEQIEVIPTLILYKNGQALGSIVAPDSKSKIEEFIEETLNA